MEALLKAGQLSIGIPHEVEEVLAQLKEKNAPQKGPSTAEPKAGEAANAASSNNQAILDRFDRLEHQLSDLNDRLRRIEASLPGSKSD